MKLLFIVTYACMFFVACSCAVSGKGTDEFHVRVSLTTGERSKDSNSKTTTITVEQNAIVLRRSSSRDRRSRKPPLPKEFKLSTVDKGKLLQLVKLGKLFVTEAIELPLTGSNYRYFRISADLTLGNEKGALNISGLRTAVMVKEEMLYKSISSLVKELYRIMNGQDKSVTFAEFEELILESIK